MNRLIKILSIVWIFSIVGVLLDRFGVLLGEDLNILTILFFFAGPVYFFLDFLIEYNILIAIILAILLIVAIKNSNTTGDIVAKKKYIRRLWIVGIVTLLSNFLTVIIGSNLWVNGW